MPVAEKIDTERYVIEKIAGNRCKWISIQLCSENKLRSCGQLDGGLFESVDVPILSAEEAVHLVNDHQSVVEETIPLFLLHLKPCKVGGPEEEQQQRLCCLKKINDSSIYIAIF
ncbi:Protein CBG19699 [Caenorhabditis briggsae]|uniref:Uncharacterized protein n=3 Tax=Caenorhabditis briggsae TaxID=6238 RepID=A0AAE9D9S7_CAEBR|nr:Protein CBG19699 [Caenorhabditis briggsae]ULT99340.1 hypothetical protein L3Y34_000589 [Caenorhabditis briggsae]CAP36902.2 Protein CBG19699 [Caenorhabditis briggsae]